MNKLVLVYLGEKVVKAVKIDSDTQKNLSVKENAFVISGGLKGILDFNKQSVLVVCPKVNFMLDKDFKSYKDDSVNIMLNGTQTKSVLKGEEIESKFTDIENVTFKIRYDSVSKTFSYKHDLQALELPYYTENNSRIVTK